MVRKEIEASRYHGVHGSAVHEDSIRGQDVSADQNLKIIPPTRETPGLIRARRTVRELDIVIAEVPVPVMSRVMDVDPGRVSAGAPPHKSVLALHVRLIVRL